MNITGQCHCGAIAYRARLVSTAIAICHCTDCQALSGSPYRATATARAADFDITRGAPAAYVKTGDSGRQSTQYFCRVCGAQLFRRGEGEDAIGIRIGTITERHALAPEGQSYLRSALPFAILAGVPEAADDA